MASAELEPITGVQGQSPWSGCQGGFAPLKLKAYFGHWMSNGAGKFSPFPKMHLYFYSRCNGRNDIGKIYVEIQGGQVTFLPLPGGAHVCNLSLRAVLLHQCFTRVM